MKKEIQYKIAKLMHDEYEDYSRKVGWKTQKKCQTLFDELPPANKEVMLWVAGSILKFIEEAKKEQMDKICADLLKIADAGEIEDMRREVLAYFIKKNN